MNEIALSRLAELARDKGRGAHDITRDLFRRLRLRNKGSGHILLCEVGDGAGFGNRGWTDAISMQTWPSRSLIVTGYEVKATRPDWLRELDKPEKNETWQNQCHEWYVVAPKDIVKLEELPASWGLMVPRGADGLRIASRCDKNGDDRKMVSLDLMAAVFRAAEKERHLEGAARREIQEEERERVAEQMGRLDREAKEWKQQHMELVEALGSRWDNLDKLKKRAAAVRQLENEHDDPTRLVRELRERLEVAAGKLKTIEDGL